MKIKGNICFQLSVSLIVLTMTLPLGLAAEGSSQKTGPVPPVTSQEDPNRVLSEPSLDAGKLPQAKALGTTSPLMPLEPSGKALKEEAAEKIRQAREEEILSSLERFEAESPETMPAVETESSETPAEVSSVLPSSTETVQPEGLLETSEAPAPVNLEKPAAPATVSSANLNDFIDQALIGKELSPAPQAPEPAKIPEPVSEFSTASVPPSETILPELARLTEEIHRNSVEDYRLSKEVEKIQPAAAPEG